MRADMRRRRSPIALAALTLLIVVLLITFTGLGVWQIERRSWKLDLIDRVEQRAHALPTAAPGPDAWPEVTAQGDEYRRVTVRGVFRHDAETLVLAVTELGGGFWVLTPLQAEDGSEYIVNRGFVPTDRRDPAGRAAGQIAGETTVVGLVRMSEPGGGFLRANDPGANRWYSRDVAAIADAQGLGHVAPYFIDADATPNPGGLPVGGLTVITFRNNHLVYALTWFALALMTAGAGALLARDAWRLLQGSDRRNDPRPTGSPV